MEGHAELVALQRLDESCVQLQKQVLIVDKTKRFLLVIGQLFGSPRMHGKRFSTTTALLWGGE
jgi:hypothetical protein